MKFLGKVAVLCVAMIMLASPAFAEKTIKWKLAMTWPSTLTPFASSVQKFAQSVSDMTGGKFVIKVDGKARTDKTYPAGFMGAYSHAHLCAHACIKHHCVPHVAWCCLLIHLLPADSQM